MMHDTKLVTGLKYTLATQTNHLHEMPSLPLNNHIKSKKMSTSAGLLDTASFQIKMHVSKGY